MSAASVLSAATRQLIRGHYNKFIRLRTSVRSFSSLHRRTFTNDCKRSTLGSYPVASPRQIQSRDLSTTKVAMPPIGSQKTLQEPLKSAIGQRAVVFTRGTHPDVQKIVTVFQRLNETAEVINLSADDNAATTLLNVTGRNGFPLAFAKGDCVGDLNDVERLESNGFLKGAFEKHTYDLVVIGGGSGGLAASKEAASFGKKVAVLDFVKPTPVGTSWGLGGTCVNVGCIPKKLMHHASLVGHFVEDSRAFGWQIPSANGTNEKDGEHAKIGHNWETMKSAVQDHIGSLNWNYRVQLREKEVAYFNAYGSFIDAHSVKTVNRKGKEETLTADKFLIAVGLRPRYPNIPGAKEHCITSDDLFSLAYSPGKTLLVGASYVSLECAGFLAGIGLDVTVMVRSILLRGFDQDMSERVGKHMTDAGIKFVRPAVPTKFERVEDGKPGRIRVTAVKTRDDGSKEEIVEEYNTVVLAIGRDAVTDDLNMNEVGIERNAKNKKVVCAAEQSVSLPNVYAIGDVMHGGLELTPVAIKAGRFLMRRLFAGENIMMDYQNVPTTVFTPLEYGACGMAEEDAIEKYGKANIEVYHNVFSPLEFSVPQRSKDYKHCYAKLVCNKADNMRVLGLHYLGPNAGEITQGYGMAFAMNATKADFDRLVGIHPTTAEAFTTMTITKQEQSELVATGC